MYVIKFYSVIDALNLADDSCCVHS